MECLTKQCLNDAIEPPKEAVKRAVKQNWDRVAKPLDGLGRFEELIAQIGAIRGTTDICLKKKAIIVMCADNGIVAEGVSQSGQEVTRLVTEKMGRNGSSVCKLAEAAGAKVLPVDIGINTREELQGVLSRKVAYGTRDFCKEPAMTEAEAERAIAVGIETVNMCREQGYDIIGTGEMGIGNTTTSSAVAAALLQCDAALVTGRGAGLSDAGLARKIQVIDEAIRKYDLYQKTPFEVLRTVGGLDIAGLVGVFIGGARYHVPIVMDGVISTVAALLAERMCPGVRDYMIPSHISREPAAEKMMQELALTPVIDAGLALGEGTGAVMMMSLLDMALALYENGTTFDGMEVTQYERYT